MKDVRAALQQSNRREVEILGGPAQEKLAAIVGKDMAASRLASAIDRQGALDSGDLIPSHMRAEKA